MDLITWELLTSVEPGHYESLENLLKETAEAEKITVDILPFNGTFQDVRANHSTYNWTLKVSYPAGGWVETWNIPWPIYYNPENHRAIFYMSGKYWSFYPKIVDRDNLRLLTYPIWLNQTWKGLLRWRKKTPSAKANFVHRLQQNCYMFSPNDHTVALSEHRVRYLKEKDTNRYVHPSYLGRIDLVVSPEGESVGLSLVLSVDAKVDSEGYVLADYKDPVTQKVVSISAEKQDEFKITHDIEAKHSIYKGNIVQEEGSHVLLNSVFGVALNLVPFVEYNDANRLTMAGNHLRQVVPLLEPELPRVRTEFHHKHPELLLGKDLLVAYGSFKGLTYEDAVVISESAAMALSADWIKIVELPVHSDEAIIYEDSAHIGDDVHPSKPLLVKTRKARAGDAAYMLLKALGKNLASRVEIFPPPFVTGHIKQFWQEKDSVFFEIVDRRPLRVGDKIVGRYGNKAIVAAILPDEAMPKTPEGKSVQVIISPASVISRMNLGQLYEVWIQQLLSHIKTPEQLSYLQDKNQFWRDYFRWENNRPIFVYKSFQRGVSPQIMADALIELGLDPSGLTTVTWDGHSTKMIVGHQHIVRLYHFSIDKIHARSTSGARSLGFPSRGRKSGGGQRVGEMEVRALLAHNSLGVLSELPYRCDGNYINFNFHLMNKGKIDYQTLKRIYKDRASYNHMLAILAGLGITIESIIDSHEGSE